MVWRTNRNNEQSANSAVNRLLTSPTHDGMSVRQYRALPWVQAEEAGSGPPIRLSLPRTFVGVASARRIWAE